MLTRPKPKENLIVSTTTSLYETGLLDVLKNEFEKDHSKYNVSFISQGTGLAIETAKRGDADMILVHSPGQELGFLESGFGVNRKLFAYNFFIIVGPESDPAEIKGLSPMDALNKMQEEGSAGNALWVSRGDNSGTHSKEKGLWKAAGFDLEELKAETYGDSVEPWYIEAGAGMTATLQLANQKEAYTLTDVATYLKNMMNGNIESVKVVDSGKETINVYSAIVCNPEKNDRGMYDASMLFLRFLLTDEVQELFETYGEEEFGSTLFEPWVTTYETNPSSEIVGWVEDFAYIDGTECPSQYRHQAGDLYN
jgi:tungstate transport system substrate-binding protein